MNIDEYRALKAQEQSQTKTEETAQPTQPTTPEPTPPATETQEQPKIPDKVTIDGIGELSIDEIKNGYLRNADYTRKTQELSQLRKQAEQAMKVYESVKQNPDLLSTVSQHVEIPQENEFQQKYFDLLVEREIETLEKKYPDFNSQTALDLVIHKRATNLEDAYKIIKADELAKSQSQPQSIDIETLKQQIRNDLLKELESTNSATQTIITTNDKPAIIPDTTPRLNEAELEFCRKTGTDPGEYAKWRDWGKKK